MALLDLRELPYLVGPGRLISAGRYSPQGFRRADHLFDAAQGLDEEVRGIVADAAGVRPQGPIRLLTQFRCFGYYFSPLNLFYVEAREGEQVEHVVAEVNNTPWGERHAYVLAGETPSPGGELIYEHDKAMHVSPFMPMDLRYAWRVTTPAEALRVSLGCVRAGVRAFDASLSLERRSLTKANLRRLAWRRPGMSAQTIAAIYYQALKLWWKRCPPFTHPNKMTSDTTRSEATPGRQAGPKS